MLHSHAQMPAKHMVPPQMGGIGPQPAAMLDETDPQQNVQNQARTLGYLQALVEQTELPIYDSAERDFASRNTYMVQACENTDNKAITLCTVPCARGQSESQQQQPGEGYSLMSLMLNSEGTGEESKDVANDFDGIEDGQGVESTRITNSVDQNCRFVSQEWSDEQEIDPNQPHTHRSTYVRSVVLNNRFYLFQNLAKSNKRAIKVVDPQLDRLFQIPLIGEGNEVTSARINYSIAHMNNRVFLYGGLSDTNEVLANMEVFDACTYTMKEVKYRLEQKAEGRQGHAAIAVDKFNMLVIGGTQAVSLLDPPQMQPKELVYSFDLEASTWHPKSTILGAGSEPVPWNLVYHSLFKVDTQNVGVLWFDQVDANQSDQGDSAVEQQQPVIMSPKRVLRTSIYNMVTNSWKTIRLVYDPSPLMMEPSYRFGTALIPIFDKHVAIREQIEMVKKIQPRAHGPVPLSKLLILGGVALDDDFFENTPNKSRLSTTVPCTVLHFTNSKSAPTNDEAEEAKDASKKSRKKRK